MELQLQLLFSLALLAVGRPPTVTDQEPLSWFDSILVVGTLVLAFWASVRFVAWIDAKIEAGQLLREIYRELRKQRSKRTWTDDSDPSD